MSTPPPPTPSISIVSPPGSSRPSLDSTVVSRISLDSQRSGSALGSSASPVRRPGRSNRSALREFYGIRKRDGEAADEDNELDREGFDAQAYVRGLLEKEGLMGLLKVENGLVNDIRGFDGERKSLVYDNYNKLITATDTIRNMRSNMDPLTPTTSTLKPAIAHIATVSASLVHSSGTTKKLSKKETIRWVIQTPERMKGMTKEEAMREWEVAKTVMGRWQGVKAGEVEDLKKRGEDVLASLAL